MKTLSLQTYGTKHRLAIYIDKYISNGNLAILLMEKVDGHYEPFADLTTNTGLLMPSDNFAVVDTNNCSWAERLIERYGLGEFESITCSGFCRYPVYSFDMDKLKEYQVEGVAV